MAAINMMESAGALLAGVADIALGYADENAATPRTELWGKWQTFGRIGVPAIGALGVVTDVMPVVSNGVYLGGIPMMLSVLYEAVKPVPTGGGMGGYYASRASRPMAQVIQRSVPMSAGIGASGRSVGHVPVPEKPRVY